jgi:hypothetical protein
MREQVARASEKKDVDAVRPFLKAATGANS